MFTNWKDYTKESEVGSWSQRVTGSGHVTVSAILLADGQLKAFPPRAASNAFPVFCVLDATASGKFSEDLSGVYPSKGWELPASVHHARAKLWQIFLGLYSGVRENQVAIAQRENAREELMKSFNFIFLFVNEQEELNDDGKYNRYCRRLSMETAIILDTSVWGSDISDPENEQVLIPCFNFWGDTWYLTKYQSFYFLMSSSSESEDGNIKSVEIGFASLSAEEAEKVVELWK